MRTFFILLTTFYLFQAHAQQHDTLRTHWVYDTVDLYNMDIRDLDTGDTLTLIPVHPGFHWLCCWMPFHQHHGPVIGLHYDYATQFRIHSYGLSVGYYFSGADMLVEVEGQTDAASDNYDFGISAWKNIAYIPVAKGALRFPLLRPGIKFGRGSNYGNTYYYYEPKIAVVIPNGRSHLYYAHHQPLASDFVGGQIWHQIGFSYYFLL